MRQIAGLSVRHGGAFASEAQKRRMMGGKYGRTPGEKSIGRIERELKAEGRPFAGATTAGSAFRMASG